MNILNLYAGIGGNRKLWGKEHKITAIEFDKEIAAVYQTLFPYDDVYICKACDFLERNYKNYDFIWASPPCTSHGQYRHNVGVLGKGFAPIIPDMRSLYGIIIFLQTYCDGYWVVENTKPYYTPLIAPSCILQRHLFWSNFLISEKSFPISNIRRKNKISDFSNFQFVADSKIKNKRQVLRNCVDENVGKYILDSLIQQKEGRES
ncbi:MAG: DNA cytosine methyltransferase [Thermotogota bacterium]|nr:DNA cytosine methyltransferase [Thermotogota bacterium]